MTSPSATTPKSPTEGKNMGMPTLVGSMGVTRSTLHLLWFISLLIISGLSYYLFSLVRQTQAEIETQQLVLDDKIRELVNVQRLSASLAQLDNLTIDQKTATRLTMLRHTGLEKSVYKVEIGNMTEESVGNENVFVHDIRITAEKIPYSEALDLVDTLHNGDKVQLRDIKLESVTAEPGLLSITIQGEVYGLQKSKENIGLDTNELL